MRKYDLTSSRVGGMNSTSLAALTPRGIDASNSFSEKRLSSTGALACALSTLGESIFSVSVLVLVLLYVPRFAPCFTPCFTLLFAPCFGSIFEVKSAVKQSGSTHSPSTFSGKQYIGASLRLEPFLKPIKPFITSLSLPAANVFSVTAISATARGLGRVKGFFQPDLLHISSKRKYISVSTGVQPSISTSCQYRLINSI